MTSILSRDRQRATHPDRGSAGHRARARRLLLPALAALPVLAVLLWLGNWQVQRLHWKHALLDAIAAAEAGPPLPLRDPPVAFTKVAVTGHFLHDREALLGAEVRGGALGARLVTPLARTDGPTLLVDRGWVPVERRQPVAHPEGEVTVVGWVRPGDARDWSSARDDTVGRRFFTFDPPAMAAALGLPAVEPYALVALDAGGAAAGRAATSPDAMPAALPDPARTLPRPTDPHLGYAITWYGLALSLCGVFAAFARRRLKEPA